MLQVALDDTLCPEAPYLPAGHGVPVQVLSLDAPVAAECLPETHGVHSAFPAANEYLPATQPEHVASGGMFDV